MGGGEDMIEPELADTKLIGIGSLPDLDRRLYGWKGGWRGDGLGCRRRGTVVERERERENRAARVRAPAPARSRSNRLILLNLKRCLLHEYI